MGCLKLHILDKQYKRTELRVSYFNKKLTQSFCADNLRRWTLVSLIDPNGEDVYLFYYTTNNTDSDADRMFWAAAITKSVDMLKNGGIKEGDAYVFRSVSDLGKIGDMVESDVAKYSPEYGKTAEFNLWSHGALDGPKGGVNTTGEFALDKYHLSPEGWGNINFNWKDEGAKAMFYGCRSACAVDDKGIPITSWAQTISMNGNMKNVEVWGQTTRSWPSLDSRDGISPIGTHHDYPTYMLGGGNRGGIDGMYRRLSSIRPLDMPYLKYPMRKYMNGICTGY